MKNITVFFWVLLGLVTSFPLYAIEKPANSGGAGDAFPAGLKTCGSGQVATVLSGDRVRLIDGQIILLADIKAPEYWPPGAPYKSWPYGSQSKAALKAALSDQTFSLFCASRKPNAFGDKVAHIKTAAGQWLQRTLLAAGHAYFYPHDQRPVAPDALYRAEAEARAKTLGLWARSEYQILQASSSKLRPGWFQIITGVVLSEKRTRGGIYLNFGTDWATDFTVQIPKRLYRQFGLSAKQLPGFEGKTIEVRGWVEWAGGPKIILDDAAQILVLPF
jgi:endonuclease YncB( thermonuclease family)